MRKALYLFVFALFLQAPLTMAQDAKFKALFMYNFTKYLEWPANQKQGDFVIEVLGSSPIIGELEIIAQKRKVGAQSIRILRISSIAESQGGNILYIPENRSSFVAPAAQRFANSGTIVISDKPGLINQGAGINFVNANGKQNFEVSKNNIQKQGVKVNSVLLSLGISVD